jgi:predicted GNAT family acetyltransferase
MIEVSDAPEEHRYIVAVDGERAGFLDYKIRGNVFVALHTEIDPSFGGQGLGSILVRQVLDAVRASGRRLSPVCPFVQGSLEGHPEYRDLVSGATKADRGEAS